MSETIDLTNYPIIAQNQGKSCEVTEIVALHGIDLAKTGYSLLLTTLTSISTTVQVVGQNMLGYTGFAVINDEIVQVNSSVAIGDNTSLSISRAMNGTVAQTLSVIDKDYIFPVNLFFVDTFNYKSKTDLNESDLFGISLDNGRVIIADDIQNWQPYSSSRLYNSYINKRVFLFRGVNGQFIKDYEGVTTNYTLRDYGEVEITISDSVATVYNEPLNSNKLFTDMYPKEMMEIMFPEYKVQYIADTDETHYPKIKDLTLGEFDKYSDFLQYICKKYALRIIFRKNNTIFIFSDIQQESIIPTETITPTNLVSITNNSDGRLVINKAEGSYIQRKDYVNEEDYDNNNKYVKFFYYKDFVGSYTILKNTEVTPSVFEKIWQELTFSMTADELKHITYDDYVLIVLQDGREFICKPSDINVNTSTLKVMCGYDKARYFDYYGRLDSLSEITATNLRLYYAPSSKPVISKYTRNIGGEDKDSNLQYPIIAGEEEIIYLNYGAVTTNDSTFSGIVKGNIVTNTFIDNTKLLYGKEYAQNLLDCPLYLYSNKIDTSSTDYIKVNSFDNSNIQVKTEWSDDKNQHLKVTFKNTLSGAVTSYTPLSVTNNFVKVDLATYNAININATLKLSIVPTSDYTYSTFLNNRNLVWQVVNKTTLSDEYFLVLDMDYPKPVSNVQLSFNVIANATKHSIVEWKSQSILQVSETDYNNIHTGDCLKLAGMLSTDVRYDRYLEHQNVKWLVRSKFTEGADFYIVLDSAYPRKYGYDNFDFIKFDRSNVILINEFYIRGNPVMESTQTYSYNSPESVAFYGTKEYNIDGKCMEKSDFEKVAGYIFNTYTGLDSTNTRMKVNIEIDQRVDIEVGNVFYITDGVITGFNNQKVMVLSKEVSLGDNGLQEQLELLTIGNYETQKITIATNTANNYTPAIAPTYSHLGGEGTTEQTTLQNQNNKIVTLYDDTEGTLTLKEIPIDTFSAITSLSSSIQPTNLTFSLTINNISASIDYRNTLLRSGAEGVILLNNEYMSYKTVGSIIGDSVTIEVTKRALGKSIASIIINGQRVQFYKVIQKVSAEGLTSNEALLGNGVTSYIQVDENKVKIVGEVEITSGNTYDSLIQYTDNTIPNGTIVVGTVTTGTATADGNVIVDVPFSYSQGTWLADSLSVYVREGGGTIIASDKNFSTSTTSTSMRFSLKPNTSYVFGVQANRTVKSGIASTAISSSNTITTVNSNYTANINGTVASTVVSNASNGNTAFTGTTQYRDGTSPTNNASFGTITTTATTDGNIIGTIPFTYTQGTNKASHILIYYREGGGTIQSTDPSIIIPASSSGSVNLILKPSVTSTSKVYSFGLQALMTTASGYASFATITNSSNITMPIGNYTGLLQTNDASNYLYQNTTVKLGKNALGAGVNKDGMYVGNTGIDNTPTNYLKFNTSIGTFDLKSTGNIRFTNGISNELFFDSGTTTNSFLKMNNGKQQLGLCTDSGGSYQGLFVGDTTLSNGKYFKYDGTDLKVGKNVKFNWIDTLSADTTQSLQYLMNKTIDQMLKGTTTYTNNLITVRSSGVGTEKAYLGNMGANGFGLKIDSDVNNYFYANTVDGVKFKTNKDVNISNTTNEINFDSTTSTNSFISMNGGSQQIGKVTGLTPLETIPAVTLPPFNGFFVGDKFLNRKNYMYYDSTGLNFKGKYFNGIAYCDTVDDFLGALSGKEFLIDGITNNPYYGKDVNGIILTKNTYTLPTIGNYFDISDINCVIPQSSVSFITSNAGAYNCTVNFANQGLLLNYDINVYDIKFDSMGGNTVYSISVNSNGVILKNLAFSNLNKEIDMGYFTSSSLQNIRILSFSNSITNLISQARHIDNITIFADSLTLAEVVYFDTCINIENIYVYNRNTSKYNLDKAVIFKQCKNVNNVSLSDNFYKRIAEISENLSNFSIDEPSGIAVPTYSAGRGYYFEDCKALNNIHFLYQSSKYIYKFRNCDRITNSDGSLLLTDLNNCDRTTNNSWNLRRNMVTDELIPTDSYASYFSYLIPQLLHIYIKETTIRFVTSGVDLDIDSSVAGSYGLYKFIYNNSLSQWELHQLTQDRDLSGIIKIKFSISTDNVIFSVKSNVGSRYITILAEELK